MMTFVINLMNYVDDDCNDDYDDNDDDNDDDDDDDKLPFPFPPDKNNVLSLLHLAL